MKKKLIKWMTALLCVGMLLVLKTDNVLAENEEQKNSTPEQNMVILDAPTGLAVTNNGYEQLKLTWDAVEGAEGYQVYRSISKKAEYEYIASVEKAEYVDKNLTTNQKYYYKIKAYAGDYISDFTGAKSGTPKVFAPTMKKTANVTASSIKISWNKVSGASGYYVYRKTASGSWMKISDVQGADNTSYKDTSATGEYYYSVRAYVNDGESIYTSTRATSIQASVLKKATITVSQKDSEQKVIVKWDKVNNATGYQVYKKIGKNGSWTRVQTTDGDTRSYSCEIPQGKYTYWKVRAIRKSGDVTLYAAYSASKSFIFSNPKFDFALSSNYGTKVNTIKLTIYNNSKLPMRFYSEEAILVDEDNDGNNRELKLVDSDGNKLSYVDVKAGKNKTLTLKVIGNKTKYNENSIIGIVFKFDGLNYLFATYAGSEYGGWQLLE